jgi:N-acetylmuramoyl-L-alanine amidase
LAAASCGDEIDKGGWNRQQAGMRMRDWPSPNHEPRRSGPTDILLLHYTGMRNGQAALERLSDPAARVSAHYLIEEDGTVFRLVGEDRRAFHAGESFWAGETDINSRSIGIELVNPGHEFGYRAFPAPQLDALIELGLGILNRHPIPAWRVLGHCDVAPARKEDPGELFDWARLASAGIGLWPKACAPSAVPERPELARRLAQFGYGIAEDPSPAALSVVLTALQRHFRPASLTGIADPDTVGRLDWLLGQMQPR